jgi:hypothetical protein
LICAVDITTELVVYSSMVRVLLSLVFDFVDDEKEILQGYSSKPNQNGPGWEDGSGA